MFSFGFMLYVPIIFLNINNINILIFAQIMRFDASMESLINVGRSESYADLNNQDFGITRTTFLSPQGHRDLFSGKFYLKFVLKIVFIK